MATRKVKQQQEQIKAIEAFIQNAAIMERSMMSRRLGNQYGGERNLYDAFGYLEQPVYDNYRGFFDRMGIATRVVEMFPDDTWGNPPVLVDGESRSDMEDNQTSFIKEWVELVKRLKLWQVLREADILCGIGKWSTIFLGAPGNYNEEAGSGGLAYLRAFDEPSSQPAEWIQDSQSSLYGMPSMYHIMFTVPGEGTIETASGNAVHYSRVIHVSENRLGTRYTGRPRLQTALNTLFDLEKIVGGAAEAVWLTLFKGIAIMAREGVNLPAEGTPESKNLKDQLNMLANRIQRFIALENVELKDLGVDEIRIRETFDIEIETLCATEKIPKRILLGSERGELASSMDIQQWDKTISTRRIFYAEPEILDPLVSWCVAHKVLTPPKSTKWKWEWKSLYEPSLVEKSQVAVNISQAADNITRGLGNSVVKENEIRSLVDLPELDQEDLDEIELEKEAKEKEEAEQALKFEKGINVTDEMKQKTSTNILFQAGGEGSGNFGHAGRPGEVGGSSASGSSNIAKTEHSQVAQAKNGWRVFLLTKDGFYYDVNENSLEGKQQHGDYIRDHPELSEKIGKDEKDSLRLGVIHVREFKEKNTLIRVEKINTPTLHKIQNLILDHKIMLPKNQISLWTEDGATLEIFEINEFMTSESITKSGNEYLLRQSKASPR